MDKKTLKNLAELQWPGNLSAEESSYKIEDVLMSTVCNENRPSVLFSGGLDSSIVATLLTRLGKNPILYVFAEGVSEDLKASEVFSKAMGIDLKRVSIEDNNHNFDITDALRRHQVDSVHGLAVKIMEETIRNTVERDGGDSLWSGTGADIIFAGDKRPEYYGDPSSADWPESFKRSQLSLWYSRFVYKKYLDHSQGTQENLKTISPLSDQRLITIITQTSPKELWNNNFDKLPLRLLAERWGIPEQNAWRPKLEAQSGSGMFNYLEKVMLKDINQLTNYRVSHEQERHQSDNLLALRLWVAWMAEKAGVVDHLAGTKALLPPTWEELREDLSIK